MPPDIITITIQENRKKNHKLLFEIEQYINKEGKVLPIFSPFYTLESLYTHFGVISDYNILASTPIGQYG